DQTYGGVATLGASTIRTDDVGHHKNDALYGICEAALPGPNDPPLADMTPKQRSRRESQLEHTWEALREWLIAHPSDEERSASATHLGQFSTTALHLLCKLPDPPVDVVRGIVSCETEVASWQDSNGWIPLHHACANGASREVLGLLCEAFPGGRVTQDKRRRTSLHFAFFRGQVKGNTSKGGRSFAEGVDGGEDEMAEIVALLGDTGAARLTDENGMLPLHYGKFCLLRIACRVGQIDDTCTTYCVSPPVYRSVCLPTAAAPDLFLPARLSIQSVRVRYHNGCT
ncbi:MAG: hypothetical protein ACPIOQ_65120, partial [Promethearchaeia archaeon]